MIKIGIIGYQTLGKALGQFAVKDKIKVVPYDLNIEEYATPQNMLSAFNADFVFVTVPVFAEDGRPNMDFIVEAANKWSEVCANTRSILVINSIVPPGTIEDLRSLFDTDNILYNPLFLKPGFEEEDFLTNNDIYIGGIDSVANKLCDFYDEWNKHHPLRYDQLMINVDEDITIEMMALVKTKQNFENNKLLKDIKSICGRLEIDYQNVSDLLKLKTSINVFGKDCFEDLKEELEIE